MSLSKKGTTGRGIGGLTEEEAFPDFEELNFGECAAAAEVAL